MNRRDFLRMTSFGVVGSTGSLGWAAELPNAVLPANQGQPLPSLGSHWTVFEKLSANCKPKLSFLNDEFKDHDAWAKQARATVLGHVHYAPPKCDPKPEILEQVDRGSYI